MVKRNSAADAIDSLNDSDRAAMEQKEKNLRMIPLPVMTDGIAWELVFSDHDFNVRDAESYAFEENKGLYTSLKTSGLIPMGGDNMSFSLQAEIDGLQKYKVISGNIRFAMMNIIRTEEINRRIAEGLPADPDTLPFARIFGLVFKGLTLEQEYDLMADHMLKKGLNEFEKCKEIGEFIHRTKLTDAKAGIKFGMDKNKIARYRMRYAMPTVMSEYRKEKGSDKSVSFVKVGQGALKELYTAYLADQSGGYEFRQEGPYFAQAWEIVKNDPDAFKAGGSTKDKPRDRDEIIRQAQSVKATFGGPEMEYASDILAWAANETRDGKPVNLLKALENLTESGKKLRAEAETLRNQVESSRADLMTANEHIASMRKDIDGLTEERDSLRAEVETLRAEVETLKTKPKNGTKAK